MGFGRLGEAADLREELVVAIPESVKVTFAHAGFEISGGLGVPHACTRQIENGAVCAWPMTDPIGTILTDYSGNGNDAVPRSTVVYANGVVSQVEGPDGFFYWKKWYEGSDTTNLSANNATHVAPAAAHPPAFDSGHTGWGQELFVSRQGGRPSSSVGFGGYSVGSGSDWSRLTEVNIASGDNLDQIRLGTTLAFGLDLFNTDDVWHHIYLRIRADNVTQIWLDGELVATGTWTSTVPAGAFHPNAGIYSPGTPENMVSPPLVGIANSAVYDTDAFSTAHIDNVMLDFGMPAKEGIQFVGSIDAPATSTTQAFTLPANETGDLLLFITNQRNTSTPPDTPAGWTRIAVDPGALAALCGTIFAKVSTGAEATVTVTGMSTGGAIGVTAVFRNAGVGTTDRQFGFIDRLNTILDEDNGTTEALGNIRRLSVGYVADPPNPRDLTCLFAGATQDWTTTTLPTGWDGFFQYETRTSNDSSIYFGWKAGEFTADGTQSFESNGMTNSNQCYALVIPWSG